MRKYIHYAISSLLTVLFAYSTVNAGTITHTDYTAGNVITAAGQNTNENTIVNEFNGNIQSVNILDGTLVNADLSDSAALTTAKFSTSVASTFTYVNTLGAYRRPVLKFISVTTIDIENNTGTANQTCVHFPNERRCVTEDTSSTSVNRRFIITEVASNSGTKNSGLIGATEATNTWYALYAWKTSDVSTDFVIVGTTMTPSQGNFATINGMFGTNAWVYLGMVRNGDNSGATGDLLNFRQSGHITIFVNVCTGRVVDTSGLRLADSTGATSLTYTYTGGTGANHIPPQVELAGLYAGAGGGSASTEFLNGAGTQQWAAGSGAARFGTRIWVVATDAKLTNSSSVTMDINLFGWIDPILTSGFNPQL